MNSDFLEVLKDEFSHNFDEEIASQQKAYLKDKFEFFGLKAGLRREVTKPFLQKEHLPSKDELTPLIKQLWQLPEREYHHFAMDLLLKYTSQYAKEDIVLFEYLVLNNSWWDTVDMIATKMMGAYFKKIPESREEYVEKWLQSGNIWLQRCAVLFQLKYKSELDTGLLSYAIESLLGSKEFFINKAIGWVLREYTRTDAQWVIDFCDTHKLHALSRKEALRLLSK